jgi:hypothetical protein
MKRQPGNAKGHKHTSRNTDQRNHKHWRITATWPDRPDRPAIRTNPDKAATRRIAQQLADSGAYVVVERHLNHSAYAPAWEIDGPAIVAAREAAAKAEADAAMRAEIDRAAEARLAAEREEIRRKAVTQARRDRASAAALMVQPPVPRTPQQRGARHTAGER